MIGKPSGSRPKSLTRPATFSTEELLQHERAALGTAAHGAAAVVPVVSAETVDPRSMALWYALDRVQWAREHKHGSDGVVLLNRYTTVYRAVYEPALGKQVVVDIDEQVWFGLSQAQIETHAANKVRAAR